MKLLVRLWRLVLSGDVIAVRWIIVASSRTDPHRAVPRWTCVAPGRDLTSVAIAIIAIWCDTVHAIPAIAKDARAIVYPRDVTATARVDVARVVVTTTAVISILLRDINVLLRESYANTSTEQETGNKDSLHD